MILPGLARLPGRRRSRFNRAPSPAVAYLLPWLSVVLASFAATLALIGAVPLMPPLGFLMLLGWRQLRPGLLPVWAGIPLGLVDDGMSGQPPGSAVLLWSAALIALEAIEWRWPWRNFLLEWMVAGAIIALYILFAAVLAGGLGQAGMVDAIAPQAGIAILAYPLVARLVAWCDRLRLIPLRTLR